MVFVACSSVLGISLSPLRIVGRIQVIGDAGGSWGAPWEAIARPPSSYQQDALVSLVRTTTQLALGGLAVAALSLVLHTVSRILAMWRPLAIRCALGATLRHLVALVGTQMLRLVLTGCAIGIGAGAILLAGLAARWPVLFSRPSAGAALVAALLATVVAVAIAASVTLTLLLVLQRGVRSVSELHGVHVTAGAGLQLIQASLAVVQLAGLLVVTYGCALILRASATSVALGDAAARDSVTTTALVLPQPAGVPWTRAGRLRAALPLVAAEGSRTTISSPDAWLGMGKAVAALGICGECRIGASFYPLNPGVARVVAIAPGALRARRITRVGREFDAADTLGSARVAVLNIAAARLFYPGGNPILRPLRIGTNNAEYAVVGIAHFEAPPVFGNGAAVPVVFVPILQHPPVTSDVTGPPGAWDSIRARVRTMPADAPSFGNPRPFSERMQEFIDPITWFGALFAGLAGSATGIAAYSLVAVMIQMVALRERDIAIRMAIGADAGRIERWILGRTLWMTVAGTALGLTGARWLGVLLHGPQSEAGDVAWLALMVAGFGALGALASLLPARRAARIEPAKVWARVG